MEGSLGCSLFSKTSFKWLFGATALQLQESHNIGSWRQKHVFLDTYWMVDLKTEHIWCQRRGSLESKSIFVPTSQNLQMYSNIGIIARREHKSSLTMSRTVSSKSRRPRMPDRQAEFLLRETDEKVDKYVLVVLIRSA